MQIHISNLDNSSLTPVTYVEVATLFSFLLNMHVSWGSSVSIVTRVRAEDRGSITGRGNYGVLYSSLLRPEGLWSPPRFLSNGYRKLFAQE
jgi:hypothetical protein